MSFSRSRDSNCLEFKNISFSVPTKKQKKSSVVESSVVPKSLPSTKKIVSNVSGKIQAGSVLAILGPSGAGKTTMLNCLTLEGYGGLTEGACLLNGNNMTSSLFAKHCVVVTQVCILLLD